MTAIIKRTYTLRNKLYLSAFLPKIEQMLKDWSEESISLPFSNNTTKSSDTELQAYQWPIHVNRGDIFIGLTHFMLFRYLLHLLQQLAGWSNIIQVNGQHLKNLQNGKHHVC